MMDGKTAKWLGWVMVGLASLGLSLVFTEPLGLTQDFRRVLITVVVTVSVAAMGWEIYHRPWKSRLDEAQRLTDEAVRVLDYDEDRALILFAQAVALTSNPRTNMNLAIVLNRKGMTREAKLYFKNASKPGAPDRRVAGEARLALARMHLSERDWEWAIEYAKQALVSLPPSAIDDRADAHVTRAMGLWQSGESDAVMFELDAAEELKPSVELQRLIRSLRGALSIARSGLPDWGSWPDRGEMHRKPESLN